MLVSDLCAVSDLCGLYLTCPMCLTLCDRVALTALKTDRMETVDSRDAKRVHKPLEDMEAEADNTVHQPGSVEVGGGGEVFGGKARVARGVVMTSLVVSWIMYVGCRGLGSGLVDLVFWILNMVWLVLDLGLGWCHVGSWHSIQDKEH